MAIEVITEFTRKGTVRTIVYVRDDDGDLVNCTNVNVTIQDEQDFVVINAVSMNITATGVYEHYTYTNVNSSVGDWRSEADIVDGSGETEKHSFAHGGFTLEEGL